MVVYFYGQNNKHGYLSNFYLCKFGISAHIIGIDQQIMVSSSEQAIMWLKALLMGDIRHANLIASETNPAICKKYGRKVEPFIESKWLLHRDKIALEVLQCKFNIPNLKILLLETGDEVLAEAAPKDNIWGIGINIHDAIRGVQWNGQNILGNTLMAVRENIIIQDKLK